MVSPLCAYVCAYVCIRVIQSWPPLCNPKDCSPPGSSVHGILQPKILEWVVISFSRDSSPPRDWTRISHSSWIGRQILYHWANWETHSYTLGVSLFIRTQVIWNQDPTLKLVHVIEWQVDKQNIVNIQRNSISTQGKNPWYILLKDESWKHSEWKKPVVTYHVFLFIWNV